MSDTKKDFSSFPVLKSSLSSKKCKTLSKLDRKNNCFERLGEKKLNNSERKIFNELKSIRDNDLKKWGEYSRRYFSKLRTFEDFLAFGVGIVQNKFMSPWYCLLFN